MGLSLKSVVKSRFRRSHGGPTSGLTLLEILVALFVIQAVVAVSAPLVVLAVSTRVQNQRADQALQAAQGEIDRIKTAVARGDDFKNEIDVPAVNVTSRLDFTDVAKVPPPTAVLDNDNYKTDFRVAKAVFLDSDNEPDLAVQVFRNHIGFIDDVGADPSLALAVFDVGVRVYRADAVQNRPAELGIEQANYGFAGNAVSSETLNSPLAVLSASVFKSDTGQSLCDYYNYLNATNAVADPDSAIPDNCSPPPLTPP
ncbi:MAG: hypothetical protein AAFN42_17860 [Cyanobacteria bacterium J06554_1]